MRPRAPRRPGYCRVELLALDVPACRRRSLSVRRTDRGRAPLRTAGDTSCFFTLTSCTDQPRTVGAPAHQGDVSDEQSAPDGVRVFDRLLAAGLSLERIEAHLAAGRVHVDGELVTDPYAPAPPPARIVLNVE